MLANASNTIAIGAVQKNPQNNKIDQVPHLGSLGFNQSLGALVPVHAESVPDVDTAILFDFTGQIRSHIH